MKEDPKMNGHLLSARKAGDEAGVSIPNDGLTFADVNHACERFFAKRNMIRLFRYSFGSVKGIGEKRQ